MASESGGFDFTALVNAIQRVHGEMAARAGKAVNVSLTLRNWVIGYHIEVYERAGVDRARYGDRLMEELASELQRQGLMRCDRRELYRYRQFYLTYPHIVEAVPPQLLPVGSGGAITQPLPTGIGERPSSTIEKSAAQRLLLPGRHLVENLSFTHFAELLAIDDPLKRAFYEIECLRGGWSARELKRQIGSLYFERCGLSRDKEKLAAMAQSAAERSEPRLAVRDPYVFEFLGIKPSEVMGESSLEDALLDKIEDFLLEMGRGFCFEARQRRVLIGDTRGFVDLVFYHRILKCHVLVELKIGRFTHEHVGQLNTYVTWYRRHMMVEGDNPPVGLLLCTHKDQALAEYALAGMDNRLFVSKYQLALPKKEDIQRFLEEKISEVGDGW